MSTCKLAESIFFFREVWKWFITSQCNTTENSPVWAFVVFSCHQSCWLQCSKLTWTVDFPYSKLRQNITQTCHNSHIILLKYDFFFFYQKWIVFVHYHRWYWICGMNQFSLFSAHSAIKKNCFAASSVRMTKEMNDDKKQIVFSSVQCH